MSSTLSQLFNENTTTFISFTIFFCFLFKWLFLANKKPAPPSPPKLPIIGNLHQIGVHPHHSLHSLSQTYGPVMLLHFGSTPVLVLSTHKTAREIMKTNDLVFANRPKIKAFEMLLYNYKDISMAPYGEYWRQMKSISVLNLLSNKRVRSYSKVREEEVGLMVEKVKSSSHEQINLSELFAKLTNDVACRVALGRKYSDESEGGLWFKKLLSEFIRLLGGFNIGDYLPWLGWVCKVRGLECKMERVAKELDDFLNGVVDEHEMRRSNYIGDEEDKDYVDILLQMQREKSAGLEIDRTSIKAMILDIFAAGTDTTYTVLEWTMAELLRNPEILKKLQTEIRKTAKPQPTIKEHDLDKFPYLKAVIKETLRLHPPLPLLVPRVSSQDANVFGFPIQSGTQVFINTWSIGRDPETWNEPDRFWPERFLESDIDFKGQDFELIPFGAGRRICPGIQFAMSIDELALANLLYRFDWSLPGGREEAGDLDMSESTGITVHKKLPLFAAATPVTC